MDPLAAWQLGSAFLWLSLMVTTWSHWRTLRLARKTADTWQRTAEKWEATAKRWHGLADTWETRYYEARGGPSPEERTH